MNLLFLSWRKGHCEPQCITLQVPFKASFPAGGRLVSARKEGPSRTFRFAGVMGNPKLIALGHEFDERP